MNESGACNQSSSRLVSLFEAAVELGSPEQRVRFLERECPDPFMRREVEALLAAHDAPDTLFGQRTVQVEPSAVETVGAMIGRYKLLQQIGEGGMGVVYMAEQQEPVRRRVALKIIKLGMDTRQVVTRFEAERQALAMMDHPNIARVLDGGATETGRPYFVMELVQGVPITEFCDENKLNAQARLKLFIQVCQAIQSAHQKGIIHRDIKPSNVLVTLHHGEPTPKVIDFGVAKATNQKLTEKTLFTQHATMIGTPAYMSPEQAEMSSMDVDTRADVYSLGVLLYELLTGSTPFTEKRLRSLGYGEIQRVIMGEEPERPSTRLSTLENAQKTVVARNRGEELGSLSNLLKGDLDWIVMKCLEKDRTRRYETATGLASDIQRHLGNEPVIARPPSAVYRFQKLARRNKLAFIATAAVVTALLVGFGLATWQAVVANRARKIADAARTAASQERSIAITERDRAQAETTRAEQAQRTAERNAYAATMAVVQADWDNANITHLRELLNETGSYPDKGFEWYYWQRMIRSELVSMRDHDAAVTVVCFSPDGSQVASGSADRTMRIWDAATGQTLLKSRRQSGEIWSLAFSADGRRLLSVSNDGLVRILDAKSAEDLREFPGRAAALSPDGRALLIASTDGVLRLLDSSSGQALWNLGEQQSTVRTLAFSSDGAKILSADLGGSFRMWKWNRDAKPTLLWEQPGPGWERTTDARPAAFSEDAQRLVIGGRDRIVRILDANTGGELKSFTGHAEQVTAVAFAPDGRRIATGGLDRTIKVWDVAGGEARFTLRGHTARVLSLAFSPNGRRLASAGEDRTAKVWDAIGPAFPRVAGGASSYASFARFVPAAPEHRNSRTISTNALQLVRFSPDGGRLVTASRDTTARVWDATRLTELNVLRGAKDFLTHANFSPDGKFITTGSHDGSLRLWNAASGEQIRVWRGQWSYAFWSRITRDGREMLTSMGDGFIRIWDMATGKESRSWEAHKGGATAAEYSPDEQRIASCGADRVVKVWDARSGAQLMNLRGHTAVVTPLVFSPDGKKLVSGGHDRTIRVWDTSDGQELLNIRGHSEWVNDINFSPDGRRLVSAAMDKTVRLWDATNGRELLTVRGNSDHHMAAVFSPDGNRLACGGDFPFFEIWEAATADQISRWREEDERTAIRWAAWDEQAATSPD